MSNRIVECVPNFSEGRHTETVGALVEAVRSVPDVYLLDQTMDPDHHRAVLTLAGLPDAVAEAAFRVTKAATDRIDLSRHGGEHPRVGATDVIPFVPIRGVTMQDCVTLARQVGQRIGDELAIPVFLYERAAVRAKRVQLEVIRQGGLWNLAERMATDPDWVPDFGPRVPHPTAGTTVVGARLPLIAFNVNLEAEDPEVAHDIARAIRFSSGGLPSLKAIGVSLASRHLVQVSMNLTNFEETPVHVAFDAVKREADRRAVRVAGSEVVGLIPEQAVQRSSEFFRTMERFGPSFVLENRLQMAMKSH